MQSDQQVNELAINDNVVNQLKNDNKGYIDRN